MATPDGLARAKLRPARADLIIRAQASAAGLGVGSASGAGDQYDRRWQEVMSPSSADHAAMQEGPHPMVWHSRPSALSWTRFPSRPRRGI
ncbi:hypothetical protein CHLRE_10g422419v5 [Chlamydomonas reinhardtii]|uniref:Uncharacterized protein n=1 Tax=Chlamydomonas reinhardtii TaxID=3055 RepID=A0A2K3D9A0_CHLRE|nr:uncharacterized protein CHLRE_10g422419v5 [Chlamydomonas reinhardtii]PNW77108.1 hypothetical protein CHLRE_10g422419v5 [Chlamydomonas reinhardtii]